MCLGTLKYKHEQHSDARLSFAAHRPCCSNTLELPDYADALLALQPELKREWAALHEVRGGQHLPGGGCPQLVTICRRVLEEKLKVCNGLLGGWCHLTRAVCSLSHAALLRVPMLLCRVCCRAAGCDLHKLWP